MTILRGKMALPLVFLGVLIGGSGIGKMSICQAQPPAATDGNGTEAFKATPPGKEPAPVAPAEKVDVAPKVTDEQIASRLEKILKATPDWFYEPNVEVEEGVVILRGSTSTIERKDWAGELARSTQDVVAVVNLIDVTEPPIWDFKPALRGMYDLWSATVRGSPWFVFCLLIIILAYIAARLTERLLLFLFRNRLRSQLLRGIAAWVGGAAVLLIGLYVVLYISGLTRLALTVLGGTGLMGLVLGIGFRDITENFLASIFLSVQTPFQNGDLVELNGVTGIVQRMTVRTTTLMTFEGNHVQIPNSVVYTSTLTNYTSAPNRRSDFVVGVAYNTDVAKAQEVVLKVLQVHPAVLEDPEPMVLAEEFASSSVNLRVYFWVNVDEHSWMKVRSALIRLVKQAFAENGISIPYEMREIVFPKGLPVQMLQQESRSRNEDRDQGRRFDRPAKVARATQEGDVATSAEGGLASEKSELQQQAEQSRPEDQGEDLLQSSETEETEVEDSEEPSKA